MSIQLTILCENSVDNVSPYGLLGEYGFSCHLRTDQGNFLFDSGGGQTIINNAERLGIDLKNLQGILLSHGHLDHTGGLKKVLAQCGAVPIYAHQDLFTQRYSHNGKQARDIGIPWNQKELEQLGATFHLSENPSTVAPGIMLSGTIPRIHQEESGDPNLVIISDNQYVPDPLHDDLSLFINTSNGLVILLGCAHAGLLNIINHALKITGQDKIHLILGGTHLKFCEKEQMDATLMRLAELDIDRIGAAHCTGLRSATILAEHFSKQFFHASVGVKIEL